jgi:hypothetical protein
MSSRPFDVIWSNRAKADWRVLPTDVAEAVAKAVDRFARTGHGALSVDSATEYSLFVGGLAVSLIVEGDVLHVDGIRAT